jgi:hypothetical protein
MLHNEEFRNLYYSQSIIIVRDSMKMGWTTYVCNSYGGGWKYKQIFNLKNTLNEKNYLEVIEMYGGITLK